ncbi:ATP-dependent helicase/nuclease subunit A [uncultured Bacteroides sp.]|uniref:UvrD-helicase domain-containing protein n=1 Tax=Bacteroides cellulolyticus TaxID=2981780 RepID=UPI00082294E1|nr:UvrD-helicase domain-containing protein [Bacteroides cellulolyticus]MCU6770521.1 UvrD-helicase domain-containing protein [Bacteroides cellulolyticus]SCH15650.1 ATP-dependent helicase/nuclease subunit A [uncultured Bacteroides sp.]
MEQDPRLLVYKASAGSGKTFTLAVQYIRQLIEDPYSYRRILAVTFTNKATTEMKERILSQLYGIATSLKSSDGYLKEIMKTSNKSVDEIRKAADTALKNIIHDYSRFRIETIDSFFQSVMRNLARELELGANMTIELNNGDVLSDAVDSMIEKLDRMSPTLYWLLEYIEERIADDKRWNVSSEIKGFGRNIFDEAYIEKGVALREKLKDTKFIPQYRKKLQEKRESILDTMKGFNEHFQEILNANGLTPADLKNGARGIGSYFNKIASGKLSNDVRNSTVEKCLEGAENWTTKISPYKDTIISLANQVLIQVLNDAESTRMSSNKVLNSCDMSLRYLNNLQLLMRIDSEVREQNLSHNRFLLSDTNALLHSIIREGDASFVYEKIGTTIDTVMIDEFQDTSRMQWENFHLLLEESLAQKEGSMIVGDIKQSIYRWRNGDWKILAGLDKDRSFRLNSKTLDTNWRSEANIIAFNNDIFTSACKVLNERYKADEGEDCTQLLDAYSDVRQKTSKDTKEGYIKLSFLKNSEEHPYTDTTMELLAEEVDSLVKRGVRVNDIAILVRKNKSIPAIADYFDKNTPYRVVSDEAFRLDASLAVCMLIDGLRYISEPTDRIACARLAVAYQKEILKKDVDYNTVLLNSVEDYLPAEFRLMLPEMSLMPLYELLEKLFVIFRMDMIEEQDAYLCAFYDAVTEYMQNNSSELTSFLTYWNDTLYAKTIPSGEISGIRILSIHKSKGLEYHTVLLPFCDWKMENETFNHMLWCKINEADADKKPFCELDLTPVNYSSAMAESYFSDSYREERLQLWVDNLNLLYVAFTRACKNLIVWCKDEQKDTVSKLLRESIDCMKEIKMTCNMPELNEEYEEDKEENDEPIVYEYGEICISSEKKKSDSTNRLVAIPEAVNIKIESLETEIDFKQSNRSADFIRGDEDEEENLRSQYIRQGQLLHTLFASIDTKEDLTAAIERLLFEGVIESAEKAQEIYEIAERALNLDEVKDWYSGEWTLYNECSIIYNDEQGKMQTRRPDRVMMKGNEVVVVDFKFGKKKPEYSTQVREYMSLLSEMGYTDIKGYIWYVYSGELENV